MIPTEVMDEINERLKKKNLPARKENYWICKLRKGAFSTKVLKLLTEREYYQKLLKQELTKPKEQQKQELINYYEARQLALKLLANAGYGAFAQKEFAYYDYRVSEIITGSGTNGIAALKLNRKFIGIDIDQDTFDIAKKNIAGGRLKVDDS
jgi:DNA polymerase elongation subunit (family B)